MTLNTNEIKSEMAQLRQEMSELKSFKSELLSEMTTQIRVLLEQELSNIVNNKIKTALIDAANNIIK
jgi:hypothetical protein